MIFCFTSNEMKLLLEAEKSQSLGFNSQLNKIKNIPVKINNTRTIFSENSLEFELIVEDSSSKKFRKLQSLKINELNINFNIRLKVPQLSNMTSQVTDSLCVQYEKDDKENPKYLCSSWYDYESNEVVCECQQQGLTINLIDNALAHVGKIKQFKLSKIDFCNIFFINNFF